MGTDRWPDDFRYISNRLVRQIVQQNEAPRSRWRFSLALRGVGLQRDRIDQSNEFALCREATKAVRDSTSTITQGWGQYIQAELDLTMGLVTVLMGWADTSHVEIAAMKAELNDPEAGRVLVALFGSASNYRGTKPTEDGLVEIPSDVDGLYGILNRTREPGDPEILDQELDRDIGHSPSSRADSAVTLLLGKRFTVFREGRFKLLMQVFCTQENTEPYDLVILGAPVWVAAPPQSPIRDPGNRLG
jgi:hypothetical protein